MSWNVKHATAEDRPWILEIVRGWGADFVVTRGRKVFPADIEAFIAFDDRGERVGLVTFEITEKQCEIVTLDALSKYQGIGTTLLRAVVDAVKRSDCRRIWLITTNDNIEAIQFYQRRGFVIAAIHRDAIAESRKIKPSISKIGNHGIPIRDEIEFEMMLA